MFQVFYYEGATLEGGTDYIPAVGTTEYVSLGVFLIEEVEVVNKDKGVTLVGSLKDRGQWLARRTFTLPFATAAPTEETSYNTADVIGFILLIACGTLYTPFTYNPIDDGILSTVNGRGYGAPNAQTYNIGDDPWQSCQDLAAADGLQLYFDCCGVLQLTYLPSVYTAGSPTLPETCAIYEEGTSTGQVSISRDLNNAEVPNIICVIAQGSNVAVPLEVFWWQSDDTTVTYYAPAPSNWLDPQFTLPTLADGSMYPTSLKSISSPYINDPTGAVSQSIANAAGQLATGSIEVNTIEMRANPAHDVDDVITLLRVAAGEAAVVVPEEGPVTYEPVNYVIDKVVIDFDITKPLQIACRPVRAAS
jgi:hypothetical protein